MMPTKCRLLPQLRHDQHHHQDQASQRKQCAQDGNTHQIKKVFQKRQFRSDPVIERFGFMRRQRSSRVYQTPFLPPFLPPTERRYNGGKNAD